MAEFEFDGEVGFEENLERFLQHMETINAEMAEILRARADKLGGIGAADDAARRKARAEFNKSVLAELQQSEPGKANEDS